MARMLHRREDPASGQKVFIAVAAYQGCGAGFAWSLFHTGAALAKAGIGYELAIYSGNCHVDSSRNRLVRDFLDGDCTDLVFLDADIGWRASDFLKLLGFDRDVAAGIYPKKNGDDSYPVKTLPGEIWSDADGLIEVEGVPTGFLRIRRHVLETLAASATLYNAKNDGAYATPMIFERLVFDGTLWGGDYVFCRKWRERGGKIYIDPAMRFEHSGEHTWHGQVGAWMRQRAGIGLTHGLAAIAAGRETAEDLTDLYDAWDNPFAAAPVILGALAVLARQARGPILECGGGLSSLVTAAANPRVDVHVLEDSPTFADHLRETAARYSLANLIVHCAPLKGGWYDPASLPRCDWALAFLDGPRRSAGARVDAFKHIDFKRTALVADDVQNVGCGHDVIVAMQAAHETVIVDMGQRSFAIGAPRAQRQARAA